MSIAPEIISSFGGAIGIGAVWAIRNFVSSRNGNGKLSKQDHKDLCEPIKKRLESGEMLFRDLSDKIDKNHRQTIDLIMGLK